jgi:hypothetical protein
MNMPNREEFFITAGGQNFECTYTVGLLDEVLSEKQGLRIYYQGNIRTQGIDVAVGHRTIATHLLNEIWPEIARHGSYNSFVGELHIPDDVPNEYLRTINNKSSFDNQDELWGQIFHVLQANYPPPRESMATSEAELRRKLADNLRKYTGDTVQEKYKVWGGAGVEIDIYQESTAQGILIYEMKAGRAQPIHLYQLRMYWDGLTMDGKVPSKGYLVVADYEDSHSNMAAQLCKLIDKDGRNYSFEIKRHSDYNLP